ncbi:MAG: nucleoside triphosphate pyrophosphohydrolase [Candidatus Cyclonatronum sp.]|uniref:nucleoside triphosphate pyrophosphohydrolase n=1 Tax=Cyclonatronum sp. TaxID=3024185 RepID=UPI0025BAD692|nr:nucleoside triphosphate pyrophosphohydrolase [Cyclonatronum sp.]MCH8488051.1 nucleoside triphosphate pyrophosphohydrolase [Cyclonatronum sp.]
MEQQTRFTAAPSRKFDDLLRVMHILRNNCPWDRKQTHESIRDLMIEEVYEAIEAIDEGDMAELKKELGDILLHVVFHAEMAQESASFDMGDVIYAIQDKLISRHPHVFGDNDTVAGDSEVVKQNWEKIKQREQGRKSVLQGVPVHLPGLLRAQRMQEKAGAVGFDWQTWPEAWKKLDEEISEFREALETNDRDEQEREFGDLLFSIVNVGRLAGLDAENALRTTNNKFLRRFSYIEESLAKTGRKTSESTLEEMDALWEEAKQKLG